MPTTSRAPILARPRLTFRRASCFHFSPLLVRTLAPCVSVPQAFVSVHDVLAHPRLCIASWRVPGWPMSFRLSSRHQEQGVSRSSCVLLATFSCAGLARLHPSSRQRCPCFPDQCLVHGVLCSTWQRIVRAFLLVPTSVSFVASCASPVSVYCAAYRVRRPACSTLRVVCVRTDEL